MTTDTLPLTRLTDRRPPTVGWLSALLGILAIGAFQGGLAMIRDPLEPLGMSVDFLERTPVDSYVWPGVFLLSIAAASLLTVAGLLSRWRWHWAGTIERALGYRWPWIGATAIGVVLLAFEMLEVYMVPFHPIMHPLLIASSVAMLLLAAAPSTRAHFRVE